MEITLDLSSLLLTQLPASVKHLTQLQILYVQNNQLTELPEWIGDLSHLREIYLDNNPLPTEILGLYEEGRLISYLQELAKTRQRVDTTQPYPFDEAKLLFVGSGKVGKTWLLQALQGKVPATTDSTKGLEIAREPLDLSHPTQEGRTLHLNCWDFGGQENYQITHQIFFSPKAIYLLVWDPRPAIPQDLSLRLERIQLSAGQTAKVLIVSTHADQSVPAVPGKEVLKERFGDLIYDFYEVDSEKGSDGTGIASLKADIAKVAAQLEGMDTPFPDEWHKARKAIRETNEATLPFNEFSQICTQQGLAQEDCESLAIVMDRMGNARFFIDTLQSREENSSISNVYIEKDLIVLDPEWLAKAVAFVIEDKEIENSLGVLRHTHLYDIWREDGHRGCPGYDEKLFGYLLWMMWKFDIAYRQNKMSSLIPELIKYNRPDNLRWTPAKPYPLGERQATLICRILQTPPIGLIPALTAAVHPLRRIQNLEDEVDTLDRNWRDGFFLETERRGTAFVELRDRDLHIVVRDRYPRDLCDQIRKTFDRIKETRWPSLKLGYRVPCSGRLADNTPCPGSFKWEYLGDKEGKQVPCEECDNNIDVDEMLEGFDPHQEEIRLRLEELKNGQVDAMVQALHMYRAVLDPARKELERAPCMFTITPDTPGGWNVWSKAVENRVRVTCWCEHPDGPHIPEDDEGNPTSEYILTAPKDWLVKAAPYISWAAFLLKAFIPVGGSVAKAGLDEMLSSDLKTQIDIIGDASKAIPTGKLEVGRRDNLESMSNHRPKIVALRHIHDALLAQVPEGKQWGELQATPTKSGELLWLCAKHAELQQPSVQEI